MVTASPGASSPDDAPFRHPEIAESFGAVARTYDRARPRYPSALVDAVLERLSGARPGGLPGASLLDVGIGTGIAAEPFRERGCTVLGLEPDPKMAELARAKGFAVEDGRFEEWDPAGRTFDGVIAGQSWHWVDPVAGAAKAAQVLRPGGRLALFWNIGVPAPELAARFAEVFASLELGLPFNPWAAAQDTDPYGAIIDRAAAGLDGTGAFGKLERLSFGWTATMGRDAWLEQTSTSGGINRLSPSQLETLLSGLGAVIDAAGGSLRLEYTTVAAIAERRAG